MFSLRARTRATVQRVQNVSPSPAESAIVRAPLDSTSTLTELAKTSTNACQPRVLVALEHSARIRLVHLAVSARSEPLVIPTLGCVPQTRLNAPETTTAVPTRSVSNQASASAHHPSSLILRMEESAKVPVKGSCVASTLTVPQPIHHNVFVRPATPEMPSMVARMSMNVRRTHAVLAHAALMNEDLTNVSAQEEQEETHTYKDVKAPQPRRSALRTLIAQVCSHAKLQPASTPAPPCPVERTPSVSQRTTQPGVVARLATRRTLRASARLCATGSFVASMLSASLRIVAPPAPAPKEPLATPSLEAAACPRPAPQQSPAQNLSPASPASAASVAIPSHVASMLPVTAKRASVSAGKGLWETATSSACLPSSRPSAPPAVESTATAHMASQTSATATKEWLETLTRAALRASWTSPSQSASVESTLSVFLEEPEFVCVSVSPASLAIPSSAVKTSMSAQATFAARTLSASTPLGAMTVGVNQNTKEILLRNVSLNSHLRRTSVPTNRAGPMQSVNLANASASQDSRGMPRTQERVASHPPVRTTLTVATMRSASL